jgi:PDZ domain
MKKWCICLLLLILVSSCERQFLSSSKPSGPAYALSYCSLLHVTSAPREAPSPKPFLGVTFGPKDLEGKLSLCKKGSTFIEIEGVMSGTPAAEAGLKKGDIVLSFNGTPICREKGDIGDAFKDMVAGEKIGSVAHLEVLRGDVRFTASARLAETPVHEQPEAAAPEGARCPGLPQSVIERALREQKAFPAFDEILSGLRQASNEVHNTASFAEGRVNPFQLKEFTYMIRHPLEDGVAARALTDGLIDAAGGGDVRVDSVILKAARLLDVDVPAVRKEDITFPGLIEAMKTVKERLGKCFGRLTPEERNLLREKALNPWDDARWNDIVRVSAGINVRDLLDSFSPLLPFLSRENLALLKRDVIARFGHNKGPILYEADTPVGKVIVGGPGPNVYKQDAALILDLGGDDVYLNNAGGTRPGLPVALVVDWQGNDLYLTKENFSQGAGLLGGGFLLDLGGDDVFDAADGGQGAGFFGLGMLYHGSGRGVFKARTYSQGVGEMGIGIIWNGDGETRYLCAEEGQALGLFKGVGMLIDEKGDDYYQLGGLEPDFRDPGKSTVSMGQGFGLGIRPEEEKYGVSGGMGILIDKEGDDIYNADYFAQGASYYYGTGILDDMSGDDRYIAGRYAQGAGIHSSVGILTDRRGNDSYYSSFGVSQGMGHDYGVGYLEDGQGDDRYLGGILSQGAATRGGVGILVDDKGNDYFMCGTECQAFARDEKCIGILADGEPGHDSMNRYGQPEVVRLGMKSSRSVK